MKTFTIDSDNNITAFPTPYHAEAAADVRPRADLTDYGQAESRGNRRRSKRRFHSFHH